MAAGKGCDAVADYLDALLAPEPEEPSPAHSPLVPVQPDITLSAISPARKKTPTLAPAAQTLDRQVVAERKDLALADPEKIRLQALLDRQFLPPIESTDPVVIESVIQEQPLDTHPIQPQEVGLEASDADWLTNGRPPWAQTRFDVLLLTVSGLVIAVPLVVLGQIYPLMADIHHLPGQANWLMGVFSSSHGPIKVLNTAQYLMAERYNPAFVESARYLVTINGLAWGLAVDSVKQPVSLLPEDVLWRHARTQRPWLAGTVKTHMCALLDIPQLAHLLAMAEAKNFRT